MIERRARPLLSPAAFALRVIRYGLASAALVAVSLAIGAVGYHVTEKFGWLDSIYAAAMILTGMGPVGELKTDAGKIFATCYALLSALVLLSAATIVVTPVVHRLLHRIHLENEERTG
jgi:hypothetical protein